MLLNVISIKSLKIYVILRDMASICIDFDRTFIVCLYHRCNVTSHHQHTIIFAFQHYTTIVESSKTDECDVI